MDDLKTLGPLVTCQSLVSRFWNRLDARDFDGLYALLTPDAIWVRGGKPLKGIAEIKAAMATRSSTVVTRHAVSNIEITTDGADRISATSYVTVYHHNSGAAPMFPVPLHGANLVLTVHDKFTLTQDGWRLAHKDAQRTFEAAHT